jgi:hypothetical protein
VEIKRERKWERKERKRERELPNEVKAEAAIISSQISLPSDSFSSIPSTGPPRILILACGSFLNPACMPNSNPDSNSDFNPASNPASNPDSSPDFNPNNNPASNCGCNSIRLRGMDEIRGSHLVCETD